MTVFRAPNHDVAMACELVTTGQIDSIQYCVVFVSNGAAPDTADDGSW
jgi:hypothetical protein